MGIPKFYRWLSERYPCVNQPISEANVPILDNLYLDMNGIIHNCTHGNDPGTKLTEDQMVAKIYMYLERLMSIVQPQKLLFMAIDGVAPRAKMNQQRSRRFKSAKERKEAEAELIRKGELVEGEGFDSNCITPGTEFMARLNNHLRFFIRKKISEDVLWQKPTIILSGHDVPGEGEHKIMEFIRRAKNLPDYEPNQRHCMYGLDADLIMLSLVSHEPHFCLLREVVSFGGGGKGRPSREVLENPCAEHFVLFHLGLLRDYFDKEFQPAFAGTELAFNIERIVDDFVLFCMLIGNDFLPALPTLDVNEGALDQIFSIYKAKLPSMGGYLTDGGTLNRGRFEQLLHGLAELESDTLEKRAADAEEFESRRSRGTRGFGDGRPPGPGHLAAAQVSELSEQDELELDLAAATLGEAGLEDLALMVKLEGEEEPVAAAPTMMSKEARSLFLSGDPDLGLKAWKERYYREKLGCFTSLERRAVVDVYLAGLLWVLDYYYRGVSSWTWFYPYHYSPMCSDLVDLDSIHVEFQLGAPFLPFQQLLAVLPAASADLLPKPYKELMTSPSSPIIDFYPENFRIDLEGKRSDWEGIVLVPFIEEKRLLAAEGTITPDKLTKEERGRNVLGDILIFNHAGPIPFYCRPGENSTETEFCTSTLASGRTSIVCNSRCTRQAPPPPLSRQEHGFLPVLTSGTIVGKGGPPGFPTLNTVKLTSKLESVGVNVLGVASKKDSLILHLMDPSNGNPPPLKMVADLSLGHHCWIRWPYVVEAIVEGVSDAKEMITKDGSKVHTKEEALEWMRNADQLIRDFLIKKGIHLGPVNSLFHVRPCQGLVRRTDGTIEKRFAKELTLSPIPATLRRNVSMKDPRFDPEMAAAVYASTQFKVGDKALFVARSNYGALATVLPNPSVGLSKEGVPLPNETPGMLHIRLEPAPPPAVAAASTARRIVDSVKVHYEPSGVIARRLGVSPRAVGKVTGNFYVEEGEEKYDVGLCVKHGGRGMCVPDYVQPAPDDRGWLFSPALVQILADYKRKFPWIFSFLEENLDEGASAPAASLLPSLSPADRIAALEKLKGWIKHLPLSRRPLVKTTAKVAPEDVIRNLQATLPPMPAQPPSYIELENVPPWLLLAPVQPHSHIASDLAGGGFDLGDRVVSLSASGVPPLGLRGTVVGIHDNACEILFDREFPEGTDLHGRCAGKCGLIMAADHLLNISKPRAINVTGHLAPRIVRKARPQAENSQAVAQAQANGSVGKGNDHLLDLLHEHANGTTKPRVSPDKLRPKVHVPLAPGSPSQRGFGVGRGKSLPGEAQGHAPSAPGSDVLANQLQPAYRRTGLGPVTSVAGLAQAAQDRSQIRQPGHALLALVQGDAKAVANPQEPASPVAPSQALPAAFPTPPGVHHSPFGHIRPPKLTFPGSFQPTPYVPVHVSKAPLVKEEPSFVCNDRIPLSDLLLGTPSPSLAARTPAIRPPPGWPLSLPQAPLFPPQAGPSLSALTPLLPTPHRPLHSVGPGVLSSLGLPLLTPVSATSLLPDQFISGQSPGLAPLSAGIVDRSAIPMNPYAPVQDVLAAAYVNPLLSMNSAAVANPVTVSPGVRSTLPNLMSAVPSPPDHSLSTPLPAAPPSQGLFQSTPASFTAASSGQFSLTPSLSKPPLPGLLPTPPASKPNPPEQLSAPPGSCVSVIPSDITKPGKPCVPLESLPAGAEGENFTIKAVTPNCTTKSTTGPAQGPKSRTGSAPPGFAPLAKHVPPPVASHAALSPDTPPSTSIVGPDTPRQGPAAPPTHTLVPSPSEDPTAEKEPESNASKAADPDDAPCIFADIDFPALTPAAPKATHGSSLARRERGAARTGTTAAEASLTNPAAFWTLLQQQNSASATADAAAPARAAAAATPPAPSPHPILEQLRYGAGIPPPPNLPRPLPPPVTLQPPSVLPRPVTLPRPDGAALLEKLKRGPLGAPDAAGKALLKKLQKGGPVGSASRVSSKKVDELSEAAKQYLDSRRADAQGPAVKTDGKGSANSLPKPPPSAPIDLSKAAIAAREAASNALKGVDEALSRSQSNSTSPRSPINGIHAPLVFDEESVVKAKRAADAALRGVKEAATQGSGLQNSADALSKGQDHVKSAVLRGALGIGRGATASTSPTEVESEASRRAKEAAAEALKGLLKKSLPGKEAPAVSHAAPEAEEASARAAKSGCSEGPAGPSCTPAEYWQNLMR